MSVSLPYGPRHCPTLPPRLPPAHQGQSSVLCLHVCVRVCVHIFCNTKSKQSSDDFQVDKVLKPPVHFLNYTLVNSSDHKVPISRKIPDAAKQQTHQDVTITL